MAGNFSQAFQRDVMEYYFGSSSTALAPSTYWIHLYNTTLNDGNTPATTGRVGTTAAADNYNPVKMPNTTLEFTAPTAADPSVSQNKLEKSFTTNATTGWGTIQAVQITTSSLTGGISVAWGDLSTDQTVSSGNTVKFSTGALQISLT